MLDAQGSHYIGRGTVGHKFTFHKIHRRGNMVKKLIIALTQIVQSGFSVGGLDKTILRTFAVAGEKILTLTALAWKRV